MKRLESIFLDGCGICASFLTMYLRVGLKMQNSRNPLENSIIRLRFGILFSKYHRSRDLDNKILIIGCEIQNAEKRGHSIAG